MTARPSPKPASTRRRSRKALPVSTVVDLDAHRILRALDGRSRYQYVSPRIEREGRGWKIVSPNCSRNIDRAGGEVAIAWLEPLADGRWQLHGRDHAQGRWVLTASGLLLADALALVCDDPDRRYWP
jgi:hypothetical protein